MDFPPHRLQPGMTLEDVVRLSSELGNHPDQTPEQFLDSYAAELLNNRGGARAKTQETLSAGRTIETAHVYSPGLGWVVTHEDVTEETRPLRDRAAAQGRTRTAEHPPRRGGQQYFAGPLHVSMRSGRLVICNRPYARIYNLPERIWCPARRSRTFSATCSIRA